MIARLANLWKQPSVFRHLTGLTAAAFDALAADVVPAVESAHRTTLARPDRQRAIGAGGEFGLGTGDQVSRTAVWLWQYPTQEALGFLFGVSDTFEQRTHRPKQRQRAYYPGAKKAHTLTSPGRGGRGHRAGGGRVRLGPRAVPFSKPAKVGTVEFVQPPGVDGSMVGPSGTSRTRAATAARPTGAGGARTHGSASAELFDSTGGDVRPACHE